MGSGAPVAPRQPGGVAAAAADGQCRLVLPAPVDAEGAQAAQGGHTVGGALEVMDGRFTVGDGVEDGGAVGDRLIAGGDDGAANGAGGTDHSLHRSSPAAPPLVGLGGG